MEVRSECIAEHDFLHCSYPIGLMQKPSQTLYLRDLCVVCGSLRQALRVDALTSL